MPAKPFNVDDKVNVIRTKRGWHDGTLEATVRHVFERPTGTHEYVVVDDEGDEHEVRHTRDMRLSR